MNDEYPNQPKISLIIPAYNEEKYLGRLLDSVSLAKENFQENPLQKQFAQLENLMIMGSGIIHVLFLKLL